MIERYFLSTDRRVGDDSAKRAKEAAVHHAGSAAALRLAAIELRRKTL